MRRISAFTLIELLVVLSIAGILTTFVGPVAYQQYLNVQRDAEVEKLKRLVDQTQFIALNQRYWTTLELDGNRAEIVSNSSPKEVNFEILDFPEQSIEVNPNGFFVQRTITYVADNKEESLSIGRELYEQ